MKKPVIALTMGDPSGVGPEIAVKAILERTLRKQCLPVVIGDLKTIARAAALPGMPKGIEVRGVRDLQSLPDQASVIPVLDMNNVKEDGFEWACVKSGYGRAAGESIEKTVELVTAGEADAMATPPIHKESYKMAGFPFPGHTEMLAALTQSPHVSLMLMLGAFRVVHVSMHTALKNVPGKITEEKVHEVIRTAHEGCLSLGIADPRIGVSALNPHGGEGGLFGDEEETQIIPAIARAKAEGIAVEGPYPGDSVFAMLRGGKFDIVVAMYHDQGGIPMKLNSFDWDKAQHRWSRVRGVNVSLGLKIIRTSVAHGTGFEIAGQGIACPDSMIEAIETACLMVQVKKLGTA